MGSEKSDEVKGKEQGGREMKWRDSDEGGKRNTKDCKGASNNNKLIDPFEAVCLYNVNQSAQL